MVAPKWVRLCITSLEEYARHFNCVEGNTTLYALPGQIVERWRIKPRMISASALNFRATISHNAALRNCGDLTEEFFGRMSPLANRIGQYWHAASRHLWSGRDLPAALWPFLDGLPWDFTAWR
ncbi:DUF72 domain-containing protein [Enterobacter cloacae subsp. cloacae]|nr:DUF72 domain-containing protein [Enterobacter cloacae subsp. cloacae]